MPAYLSNLSAYHGIVSYALHAARRTSVPTAAKGSGVYSLIIGYLYTRSLSARERCYTASFVARRRLSVHVDTCVCVCACSVHGEPTGRGETKKKLEHNEPRYFSARRGAAVREGFELLPHGRFHFRSRVSSVLKTARANGRFNRVVWITCYARNGEYFSFAAQRMPR